LTWKVSAAFQQDKHEKTEKSPLSMPNQSKCTCFQARLIPRCYIVSVLL